MTTELVTNAVLHAVTPLTVELAWNEQRLRIDVCDGSSIVPAVQDLPFKDGGAGLRIVAGLARDWGVTTTDDGKAVWIVVDRESAETLRSDTNERANGESRRGESSERPAQQDVIDLP